MKNIFYIIFNHVVVVNYFVFLPRIAYGAIQFKSPFGISNTSFNLLNELIGNL